MTAKDKICDICGNSDYYLGVCSSALVPYSHAICAVCGAMHAEETFILDGIIEDLGGVENMVEGFCYYDREKDVYIDTHTRLIVPIELENGMKFETRTEYVNFIKN